MRILPSRSALIATFIATIVVPATVCASQAIAAPEWLDKGAAINVAETVKVVFSVLLSDLKEKSAVRCTGTGTGLVGPKSNGEFTKLTVRECITQGACEEPVGGPVIKARAEKTPWKTQLVLNGGGITQDQFTNETGWTVECLVLGVNAVDTCTWPANVPELLAEKIAAPVDFAFPIASNENKGNCNKGGNLVGDIQGEITITGEAGHEITIS
jgi:hypothetical protein